VVRRPGNDVMTQPHLRVGAAITAATEAGRTALVPFITAGYPRMDTFIDTLRAVAAVGEVVEIGVPFSDPMADGLTIQRSSHAAIEAGVSLRWIVRELTAAGDVGAPLVLMSYLNPLLNYGYAALARDCVDAGVCGFIVPDLPLEESGPFRSALDSHGLALIPLVTPATPEERMARVCTAGKGFIYAVLVTGVTGGGQSGTTDAGRYLAQVRVHAGGLPVCAGFGVRRAEQVAELGQHADGVIVGSALVEELEAGRDPAVFLQSLRPR
jgi:tryptophan synthase alpha chain